MPARSDVAIVTGASSGIGRETARRLANDGYRVVLAARRSAPLEGLAADIEADGGAAVACPTDVTDREDVEAVVQTTTDEFGQLDVLVNSAGVMSTDHVVEADPADWRRMVEVNLLGLMDLTRTALPRLLEGNPGHIVFVSSVNARKSSKTGSGYCASKAGVNGFADSLRKEVTEDGVRVTVVEPGMVETAMQPDEVVDEVPTLDPEAVAESIGYAVSQPPDVSVNELLVRPTAQEF